VDIGTPSTAMTARKAKVGRLDTTISTLNASTKNGAVYIGLIEHLGDIVACEPVSRYLKSVYPDREIVWAARPCYAELISTNPNIDRFYPIECLTEWIRLSKHVRNKSVIVDLHVNYRACECCRVPLVKSAGNKNVSIHDWYDYGALLESFSFGAGLPALNDMPTVYIQTRNIENVNSLRLPERYVVIHRHSNETERDWDDQKWAILVQLLLADGHNVVEIGSKPQGDSSALGGKGYIDFRGRTSFLDMAEVLRRATLFVGIDSGPAHVANAVGSPGVILLGVFGNFRKYTPYTGYYASDLPSVKLIRNLSGPASDIAVSDAYDAVCYVLNKPDNVLHGKQLDLLKTGTLPREKKNDGVQVLAFYLPQFHPIPENDHAWGPGFTEWTNIIRTRPLFEEHRQPIEAGELGYYDLRSPEIISRQVELATEYGVDGFVFYYYYFTGKNTLKTPLDNFLVSDVQMPFCLLWANHNWTKKWDASEHEIIIKQDHNDYDDIYFIRSIYRFFRDDRYIKVNGKPVLGVFMPHLFPNIKATTIRWREEVEKGGFKGLYLLMIDDWNGAINSPKEYGFDATYEMPSNAFDILPDRRQTVNALDSSFTGKIINYDELAAHFISRPFPSYKRLKTVMAPWDNSPRYKERAIVCRNTGYETYRKWLTSAIVETYRNHHEGERFVFVHSWNEWAEGTSIEPSGHEGRARLEETRKAIRAAKRVIEVIRQAGCSDELAAALKDYFWYLSDISEDNYRLAFTGATANNALVENNQELKQLILANNDLVEENKHLKQLLSVYENSRSMLVTKPLRRAALKLRQMSMKG
jgi:ADP-heptose:LPS heptosyltransferase